MIFLFEGRNKSLFAFNEDSLAGETFRKLIYFLVLLLNLLAYVVKYN